MRTMRKRVCAGARDEKGDLTKVTLQNDEDMRAADVIVRTRQETGKSRTTRGVKAGRKEKEERSGAKEEAKEARGEEEEKEEDDARPDPGHLGLQETS
ncbi:hypothetical protein PUN28_006182 [Cardiocondyla obscurior]|uniref:Uncharacterized protein n=1 Tax=Cardiocondyla obscurior TaxID=286306 RepID=A0AAW2G7G4_9HYME